MGDRKRLWRTGCLSLEGGSGVGKGGGDRDEEGGETRVRAKRRVEEQRGNFGA